MRSVERTVEEILLPAIGALGEGGGPPARPSTASAGAGRPAGSPRRCAPRRRPTAPSRRPAHRRDPRRSTSTRCTPRRSSSSCAARGLRDALAPGRPRPAAHRPRARRAHAAAVVLVGRHASLDTFGRLVYAARARRHDVRGLRLPRRAARDGREHGPEAGRAPARRAREAPRGPRRRRTRAHVRAAPPAPSAAAPETSAFAGTFRRRCSCPAIRWPIARSTRCCAPSRASAAACPPTSSARASPRPASRSSSCSRPRAASSSCARCATGCARRRPTPPRSSPRSSCAAWSSARG